MKKILALLLAAVLVLGMAACAASPAAPTQTTSDTASDASDTPASNAETPAASSGAKLRFVTGGESGTYYAFGSVIAQHATNNAGIDVVGLVGNGSQSNIFELEDGNAELAFCQSDVMAYAYAGTNLFADTGAVSCFSTVAALYTEQVQIVNLLNELQDKYKLTYLFISHDLSVVEHISDTVGVMYLGNLVEYGAKEDIFRNPLHPYTKALFSAIPVPDPTVKMNRIVLEGSIPSPANPPKGCKFHTRCANCMKCCEEETPVQREIEPGHFVCCHLYDK